MDNSYDVNRDTEARDAEARDTEAGEITQEPVNAEERRYHAIGAVALLCIGAVGLLLLSASNVADSRVVYPISRWPIVARDSSAPVSPLAGFTPSRLVLSHLRILDTIYTTDSVYLDVNLVTQHVTVVNRSGARRTFPISSGNKLIPQGIATPVGVFTVQNKTPLAISKQFKNAKLYWWIGVQGGVGFHGLDGTGYYWNLGRRPSSHGCIRMAREDIKQMYSMVHPGALIRVHDGDPARVVQFCAAADTNGATIIDSASVHNRNLGRSRLSSIMAGSYWTAPQPRIVHLAGKRLRWGMEVGEGEKIPKQTLPGSMLLAKLAPRGIGAAPDRLRPAVLDSWSLAAVRIADSLRSHERVTWEKEKTAEPEYGE